MRRPRGDAGAAVIDFTQSGVAVPAGVTGFATSASNVWPQSGVSTAVGTGLAGTWVSGTPLLEVFDTATTRGGGPEWMYQLFGPYGNRIALDGTIGPNEVTNCAFQQVGGSAGYSAASGDRGSPCGSTGNSARASDSDVLQSTGQAVSPSSTGAGNTASSTFWTRGRSGGANGLPTTTGLFQAIRDAGTPWTTVNNLDTTWRRYFSRGGAGAAPLAEYRFTTTDVPTDVAPVGDVEHWGWQAAQRTAGTVQYPLPLTDGSVTVQGAIFDATLTAAMVKNGVLDVQFTMRMWYDYMADAFGTINDAEHYLFSGDIGGIAVDCWLQFGNGDGTWRLWFTVGADSIFKSNIISAVNSGTLGISGNYGDELYVRLTHDRVSNFMMIRTADAGAYVSDTTGAATETLGAAGNLYIGTNRGANTVDAIDGGLTRVQGMAGQTRQLSPEGVWFGDLTSAQVSPANTTAAAANVYTYAESRQIDGQGRRGIINFSTDAYTLTTALAAWTAWTGNKATVSFANILLGVQDILAGATLVQFQTRYAALISALQASNPFMIINVCLMTPAAGWITGHGGAGVQTIYDQAQAWLEADGAGTGDVTTSTYYSMAIGPPAPGVYTADFLTIYDSGNNIRPNIAGDNQIGALARIGLTAAGALP